MNSSYSEQHHFGYRWYDQNKVEPCFEFGFGLSYTTFEYSHLKIDNDKRSLTFNVTNTGNFTGSEIVQVYLGVPETDNFKDGYRSPKVLKGFAKVRDMQPGDEQEVTITLKDRDFSYWCVKCQKWTVEPGTYEVFVGASSRDISMNGTITI
jgi:beta-glucosidase